MASDSLSGKTFFGELNTVVLVRHAAQSIMNFTFLSDVNANAYAICKSESSCIAILSLSESMQNICIF